MCPQILSSVDIWPWVIQDCSPNMLTSLKVVWKVFTAGQVLQPVYTVLGRVQSNTLKSQDLFIPRHLELLGVWVALLVEAIYPGISPLNHKGTTPTHLVILVKKNSICQVIIIGSWNIIRPTKTKVAFCSILCSILPIWCIIALIIETELRHPYWQVLPYRQYCTPYRGYLNCLKHEWPDVHTVDQW